MALLAATLPAWVGCADIQIRTGMRPDVSALTQSLEIGKAKEGDLLRILGTPFGEGRAMLPIHGSPREMWSYYYEEGTLEDDRRIFLFVFIDDGTYDGYMWFSSLPD